MRIFWCAISLLWQLIVPAYATAQDAPPELAPWVSQLPTGQFTLQSFARRAPDQPLSVGEQRTLCIETPQWQALVAELLHIDDRTFQRMECQIAKREWSERQARSEFECKAPRTYQLVGGRYHFIDTIDQTETQIVIHSIMQGAHDRPDQAEATPVYTETRFELTPSGECPRPTTAPTSTEPTN